jgi:hypothetical protein
MRSIDVTVTRGARVLGLARQRPVRVTPNKRPGVVYKGRVYEVLALPAGGYCINAEAESWDEDMLVCPFATAATAKRLIASLSPSMGLRVDRRQRNQLQMEQEFARVFPEKRAPEPGPKGRDADTVREILKLLSLPGA